MPTPTPSAPRPLAEGRLFGEVFRTAPKKRTVSLLALAIAGTAAVHGLVWGIGRLIEPSLETWSATVAARVHAELVRESELDLSPLPKPAAAVAKVEPLLPTVAKEDREEQPPARTAPPKAAKPSPAPIEKATPAPSRAPAEAAKALTAQGPVDLGDEVIVEGKGDLYAGGATHAEGSSKVAVDTKHVDPTAEPTREDPVGGSGRAAADGGAPARAAEAAAEPDVDRSAPARIRDPEWQCPWPRQADDERIDTQAVIVSVTVGPSGAFEGARLLKDPGRGFGAAALDCTKTARYQAALDKWGQPARSTSAIRITFTR